MWGHDPRWRDERDDALPEQVRTDLSFAVSTVSYVSKNTLSMLYNNKPVLSRGGGAGRFSNPGPAWALGLPAVDPCAPCPRHCSASHSWLRPTVALRSLPSPQRSLLAHSWMLAPVSQARQLAPRPGPQASNRSLGSSHRQPCCPPAAWPAAQAQASRIDRIESMFTPKQPRTDQHRAPGDARNLT